MKLVKNDLYLLLINEESEIKEGDYYLDGDNNLFTPQHNFFAIKSFNKVIGYYPLNSEAKELDLPLLPNPFEEVSVEELALKAYSIDSMETLDFPPFENIKNCVEGFIEGYKAAQQSKQFSLEDMLDAFEYGLSKPEFQLTKRLKEDFEKFIQSLSTQQLPVGFEPEYDLLPNEEGIPNCYEVLKTITNKDNKQELVGTYKY